MGSNKNLFLVIIMTLFSLQSIAAKYVATIVVAKGDVKIFHNQIKKSKRYKKVSYEGKIYSYEKAKIGKKIKPSDIIHSGPGSKAKVIYSNGDHFIIGPGSSVKMPNAPTKNKLPTLDMFYGKVRSMISKKGGLTKLRVKTKSAVAGVRGTDFFISDDGVEKTKITVLRGKVEVKKNKGREKALVQAGYSASVTTKQEKEKVLTSKLPKKGESPNNQTRVEKEYSVLRVYEAPKSELLGVQKSSIVSVNLEQLKGQINESVKKEIEKLEEKATEAVIEDIKIEDKQLFEKIKNEKIKSSTEINTVVVSTLFKKAPIEEKKKLKVSEDEIDDLGGEGVYDKYFKVE